MDRRMNTEAMRAEIELLKKLNKAMGVDIVKSAKKRPFEDMIAGAHRASKMAGWDGLTDKEAVETVLKSAIHDRNGPYWGEYEDAMFNRLLECLEWLNKRNNDNKEHAEDS